MADKIYLEKVNEVHMRVHAERGVLQEISEYFTFKVPGSEFSPAFKNKMWDGKIRLLNLTTKCIYLGLLNEILRFCKNRQIEVSVDEKLIPEDISFTEEDLNAFIAELNLLPHIEVRDYQKKAILTSIRQGRDLMVSPTSSGKSLIIYILAEYFNRRKVDRVLIIVPSIDLVNQLTEQFEGYTSEKLSIMKIKGGVDRSVITSKMVISTWQSLKDEPESFFSQFGAVFGDEVHTFTAKSLVSIMEKLSACKFKIGCTGTLQDTLTHSMTLQGLFWKPSIVTTARKLIDDGYATNIKIKAIRLQYPAKQGATKKKVAYADEMNFLFENEERTDLIAGLAASLKGNVVILFRKISHGERLYEAIKQKTDKNVYLVYGEIDDKERTRIRNLVKQDKRGESIIVGSYPTMSTGIDIPSLKYGIFASPWKDKVKVRQSIGRLMRLFNSKDAAYLYDFGDDLSEVFEPNYALDHFILRVEAYDEEKFDYKFSTHVMKGEIE